MIISFYVLSIFSMLLGGVSSYFHGIYSKKSEKIKERVAEFFRNAFIQVAAMLFALATALVVYNNGRMEKELEAKNFEQSSISTTLAIRSAVIEKGLRQFLREKNIYYVWSVCPPTNSEDDQRNVRNFQGMSDACKEKIVSIANEIVRNQQSTKEYLRATIESVDLRDDWSKNPFLQKYVDRKVLKRFLQIQETMEFNAERVLATASEIEQTEISKDKFVNLIYLIMNYSNNMNLFKKNSILYLITFYASFQNVNDKSDSAIKFQERLKDYTAQNNRMLSEISLEGFVNSIMKQVDTCNFQGLVCDEAVRSIVSRRYILD
ncbi:hypothetical protein [Methylorubrum suomiense]|uniref:Phage abortive infection protein n=1 Tax=Methylorubrum suomiense TaxID=144191 RepID=A0ABQ4V0I2_9HYPH|nr:MULTISPECIES: hypothetical protein [Methylobacteriaceae]GJE76432.1 hypothetical protein BGCPKDLD_3024 [Methylorubrum suomiense]